MAFMSIQTDPMENSWAIRSLPDELVLEDRVYVARRWIGLDLSTRFLSVEA